jgi:hypothetical protein
LQTPGKSRYRKSLEKFHMDGKRVYQDLTYMLWRILYNLANRVRGEWSMKFVFLSALASLVLLVPATAQDKPGFNNNVHQLFLDDQKDRGEGAEQLPWDKIAARDLERRSQVHRLLESGSLKTAEDFHDAAFIYQHGQSPDDYLLSHVLGTVAVAKGDATSLWISAASLDRYLQSINRPQIFGTQYHSSNNSPTTQDPYDTNLVPDKLRAALCVPSLEQQQKNIGELNAGRYPDTMIPKGCSR